MATEMKMPQLSDTMHSGKILSWFKKEGDVVNRGDGLAEVETDKANLTIECFQPGVLLKIVAAPGTNAAVGDIIAYIGQAGEQVTASASAPKAASPAAATPSPTKPAPAPQAAPQIERVSTPQPMASTPVGEAGGSGRVKASPLARKIAEQRQVNLASIHGSGPGGRIIKKDLDAAPVAGNTARVLESIPAPAWTPSPAQASQPVGTGSLTPFSKMRETIAKRMVESVTTAPHFYVTTSVNMREAMRLREILKEKPEYKGISINHLVIKAVGYGLNLERRVNRSVRDGQLYDPPQINVGIITAIEDGLLIPVIKDVNALPLKDVVFESRAAVDRARAGRPNSTDLSGGTFSVSNMGMFDVENFTAIINPGQGGILAVSSIKEEPVVEHGIVVAGHRMKATISVDHRIIDGVMAGTFLKHFKEALETPALLMI